MQWRAAAAYPKPPGLTPTKSRLYARFQKLRVYGRTLASGRSKRTAEREAALEMVADRHGNHRITLGADKAYGAASLSPNCGSSMSRCMWRRTTRHPGYAASGRVRKRVEEVFDWTKAAAGFRKTITVVLPGSTGCSCWLSRPTISSG
jgi:hypothetical protein